MLIIEARNKLATQGNNLTKQGGRDPGRGRTSQGGRRVTPATKAPAINLRFQRGEISDSVARTFGASMRRPTRRSASLGSVRRATRLCLRGGRGREAARLAG